MSKMQSESLKTSIPFVSYITHTSGISVIAVFIVRTLISIITPIKFALITFFCRMSLLLSYINYCKGLQTLSS